jgi:Ni,Fe-hydrogenase III small subunit
MIKLVNTATVVLDSVGAAVVKPGIVTADKGVIIIDNQTGKPIQVYIPGLSPTAETVIEAGPRAIPVEKLQPGVYACAIYSEAADEFARGYSSPKIIIK